MITKRLINCDFLNESSFTSCLSNKAKLLYFSALINADDMGFVGNMKDIAQTYERCEEDFENTLFSYKYTDAISELVNRRFLYEFIDKCGNKIYLIKHWFLHNKQQDFLTTNYKAFLKKVEIIDDEYQMKNHQEGKPLKEKEIKVKQIKTNNSNSLNDDNVSNSNNVDSNNKPKWEELIDDIERCHYGTK